MIKTIAIILVATATLPPLTLAQPQMQIAEAGVQEVQVTENDNLNAEIAEGPQIEDLNGQEVATIEPEVTEPEPLSQDSEPQNMPTPADEFEYTQDQWQPMGVYYITHYSAEECGNNIGALGVEGGLTEGWSIAMPEPWMLGHTFLIENYGIFRCEDLSPDGIADIFHYSEADAVGADYQMVWLVE